MIVIPFNTHSHAHTQAELRDLIATAKHMEIIDFDDHLNDVSKGWLQPILLKTGNQDKGKKPLEVYP